MKRNQYYKLAQPNGWDFKTGKTINYRENIGKTVKVTEYGFALEPKLCSQAVLHASKKALNCFVGAKIPCSAYLVEGEAVIEDEGKAGFRELKVISEISEDKFNDLFRFNYAEAVHPFNPLQVAPPTITEVQIRLLKSLDSVRNSIWDSVRISVWNSIRGSDWNSVRNLVWNSIRGSVWNSIRGSVRDSDRISVRDLIWDSVRNSDWNTGWNSILDSVWDSEYVYLGSLFPHIKWRYQGKIMNRYPFQSNADLLRMGLIPIFDGASWHLVGGRKAEILYSIKREDLAEV